VKDSDDSGGLMCPIVSGTGSTGLSGIKRRITVAVVFIWLAA